jgi:uncharacterized cupin superfamily protein
MVDILIKFGTSTGDLGPAPINADWILEGNPVARNKCLSRSNDGTSSNYIWDCTAGRFNWYYQIDETVCVLEGSVHVRDHNGASRLLEAGDTAFFPAGSSAEWTVPNYVRKVAFMRHPLPSSIMFAKKIYAGLKRVARFGRAPSGDMAPRMS